jgi:hypothetical protein
LVTLVYMEYARRPSSASGSLIAFFRFVDGAWADFLQGSPSICAHEIWRSDLQGAIDILVTFLLVCPALGDSHIPVPQATQGTILMRPCLSGCILLRFSLPPSRSTSTCFILSRDQKFGKLSPEFHRVTSARNSSLQLEHATSSRSTRLITYQSSTYVVGDALSPMKLGYTTPLGPHQCRERRTSSGFTSNFS